MYEEDQNDQANFDKESTLNQQMNYSTTESNNIELLM